ncbi:hypothetical protein [Leifsonia sp. AG29]|uniref:hypothetical protein n=1 Tax=Leifsonia sp. AG29 TaxID=2598860 RepID=UPI00131BF92B|nr:hypothetical protein [Leifsonia sp. AG29]
MFRVSMFGEGFAEIDAELVTIEGESLVCRDAAGQPVARYRAAHVESIGVIPGAGVRTGSRARASAEHPNAYRRWSEDDEQELVAAFHRGEEAEAIAARLGRRVGGVRSRLVMLGLIEPEPGDRLSFPASAAEGVLARPRLLSVRPEPADGRLSPGSSIGDEQGRPGDDVAAG